MVERETAVCEIAALVPFFLVAQACFFRRWYRRSCRWAAATHQHSSIPRLYPHVPPLSRLPKMHVHVRGAPFLCCVPAVGWNYYMVGRNGRGGMLGGTTKVYSGVGALLEGPEDPTRLGGGT